MFTSAESLRRLAYELSWTDAITLKYDYESACLQIRSAGSATAGDFVGRPWISVGNSRRLYSVLDGGMRLLV